MTKINLLHALQNFTEQAVADMLLPTKMAQGECEPTMCPAGVYLTRLPDSTAATKKVPYILHQVITGLDKQQSGQLLSSKVEVRTIFAVYHEDEQQGGLLLLQLMERLRIALLRNGIMEKQFVLNLEQGVETLVYPEDTPPYFIGEMATTWNMLAVEREVIW